ncbi:hypothetical protein [Scytonema sp. NUACC21]
MPNNRPANRTPLVIGLQGMSAPYGWNAYIVPTLTQMGYNVLPDLATSPLGHLVERVQPDLKPLVKVLQVVKKTKRWRALQSGV